MPSSDSQEDEFVGWINMNHRMPRNRLNSSNYKTSKCLQKEQKLYKWYNRLLHRYVVLNAMVKKMPNVVVVLMFQKGKIENWVMQDTTTMWVAVAADRKNVTKEDFVVVATIPTPV